MFAILASCHKTIIFAHTLYTLQGSVSERRRKKQKNEKIIYFFNLSLGLQKGRSFLKLDDHYERVNSIQLHLPNLFSE